MWTKEQKYEIVPQDEEQVAVKQDAHHQRQPFFVYNPFNNSYQPMEMAQIQVVTPTTPFVETNTKATLPAAASPCKSRCRGKVAKAVGCCLITLCVAALVMTIMSMIGYGMVYKCLHPKYSNTRTFTIDPNDLQSLTINAMSADVEFKSAKHSSKNIDDGKIQLEVMTGAKTQEDLDKMQVSFSNSEVGGEYSLTISGDKIDNMKDLMKTCQLSRVFVYLPSSYDPDEEEDSNEIPSNNHNNNNEEEEEKEEKDDDDHHGHKAHPHHGGSRKHHKRDVMQGKKGMSLSVTLENGRISFHHHIWDNVKFNINNMGGVDIHDVVIGNTLVMNVHRGYVELEESAVGVMEISGQEAAVRMEQLSAQQVTIQLDRIIGHFEEISMTDARALFTVKANEGKVKVEQFEQGALDVHVNQGKVKLSVDSSEFCGGFELNGTENTSIKMKGEEGLTMSESSTHRKVGTIGGQCSTSLEDATGSYSIRVDQGKIKMRLHNNDH